MRQFFWLLNGSLALASAEVLALAQSTSAAVFGDILLVDSKHKDLHKRLALSRAQYEFLFACHVSELEKTMAAFDWQAHYAKSFKLEIHDVEMHPKQLAGFIWNNVKKPKVDLEKPGSRFELFFRGTLVIAGKRIATIDAQPFFDRRPHLRPAKHPSGMQPRLARALINLTGARKGTVYDPFCGAGGFMIEAASIGLKTVGSDIVPYMVEKAKANLKAYKIKAKVSVKDATKLTAKMDYVVSDFPYGRNTKKQNMPKLYLAFLKKLKRLLKYRAVLVFPDFIDHKKLIKQAKLTCIEEFSQYVHGTLTRTIVVLEP